MSVAGAEIVAAFVTPAIACLVACIAYKQWRINVVALKEKPFDQRFAVFKDVQNVLSEIAGRAKMDLVYADKLAYAAQRARFFFGDEIAEYILDMRKNVLEIWAAHEELDGLPSGDKRTDLVRVKASNLKYAGEQLSEIFRKFGPYMDFSKIR